MMRAMTQNFPLKEIFVFLLIGCVLSLPFVFAGWDVTLAKAVYDPKSQWAWEMRQYSVWICAAVSVAALAFLVIWPLRQRYVTLRRTAVVWLVAMILGGGLINQVVVKDLAERPRPRESVLIEEQVGQQAALKGKSFPSGHASMGFIFAVPFFVLWRQRARLALAFLAFGAMAGFTVGAARMVLGAHYFTDILWAGVILYITASMAAWFFDEKRDVSNKITVPFLLLCLFCLVWFNKFSMTLRLDLLALDKSISHQFNLPCAVTGGQGEQLVVELKGYGAPLSFLTLQAKEGQIYLERWKGVYRGLNCTAKLQ